MTIGLWVLWSTAMVAVMVPVPLTLTAVRVIAAGAVPLAVWAAIDLGWSTLGVIALLHAALGAIAALNALVGDRFVDGGSYGDERRMLLRPAAQLTYVLVPAVWITMVAAITVGPLLLADRAWLFGTVLTALGAVVVVVGGRALHQLTQRWIVFVPTGMVFHDLTVVTEPVLFRRTAVERLGAAIAGSPARDLSAGAAGLLIECELTDPAPLGLRDGAAAATLTDVRRFLFCPSRPGALLDEATSRSIATD